MDGKVRTVETKALWSDHQKSISKVTVPCSALSRMEK